MKSKLAILTGVVLSVLSCSQNEPLAYENAPALYFPKDEFSFSFFYTKEEIKKAEVKIVVHAMGYPADADRPFVLSQSNIGAEGAAVAGTHYLPFDSDEMKKCMVMPAGRSEVEVPVTLYNEDARLQNEALKLTVQIVGNEHFSIGVSEMQRAEITFSAQTIKPGNWDEWESAFGESFGSVKMRFIMEHTGITEFDEVPQDDDYLRYLNEKLIYKLAEYNRTHPGAPLSEPDGTLVSFNLY